MTIQKRRIAAANDGEMVFDSGKPCPLCGEPIRYVSSNQCVPCTKSKAAAHTRAIRNLQKRARLSAELEALQ